MQAIYRHHAKMRAENISGSWKINTTLERANRRSSWVTIDDFQQTADRFDHLESTKTSWHFKTMLAWPVDFSILAGIKTQFWFKFFNFGPWLLCKHLWLKYGAGCPVQVLQASIMSASRSFFTFPYIRPSLSHTLCYASLSSSFLLLAAFLHIRSLSLHHWWLGSAVIYPRFALAHGFNLTLVTCPFSPLPWQTHTCTHTRTHTHIILMHFPPHHQAI